MHYEKIVENIVLRFCEDREGNFGCYILSDPETGIPFYTGKEGKRGRLKAHLYLTRRGSKLAVHNKIRKILSKGFKALFQSVFRTNDELEAQLCEIALISAIGRRNLKAGPLLNLTDGGEGGSGYVHTEKAKRKLSEANLGAERTPEHRARIKKMWAQRDKNTRDRILQPWLKSCHSRSLEQRRISARKSVENNPRVKRCREHAVEIYLAEGRNIEIAKRFGVTQNLVSRIKRALRGYEWVPAAAKQLSSAPPSGEYISTCPS